MDFNEAMFMTKVDNIFVKLHTCVMKGDLSDVDHFISDEVYEKYQKYIDELKSNDERQMYDELNVKSTKIMNVIDNGDSYKVEVEIISRYMDYVIDVNDGTLKRGINTSRVEKRNILTFEKKKEVLDTKIVRKCPGCGASISVNTSGQCSYCGTIYNLEDYDFILKDIVTY